MDTNNTLKNKVNEIVAKLRNAGEDKPDPNEAFNMLDHKGDMIYLLGEVLANDVDLHANESVTLLLKTAETTGTFVVVAEGMSKEGVPFRTQQVFRVDP
jgi:hypothetical protein